ncbi:MAG: FtsX-like permease family protein [Butyricicoccus pullicaecorum]|nr:FtsX-like permease family protein [Butyricicoccus pullicaecorum]
MGKRVIIYLKRKYRRSVLLFMLLFVVSFSLSVGICVWHSISSVTREIQQTLGTSFVVRLPTFLTQDPSSYIAVESPNGTTQRLYNGPKLDDTVIQQIVQVNGITTYNANNDLLAYPHLDDLQLIAGEWTKEHKERLAHPEEYFDDEGISNDKIEMLTRSTAVYGNSDTSLADQFRTGAFKLVEGRHIQAGEQYKALISEQLAEINNLEIGDIITVTYHDGGVISGKPLLAFGEPQNLEVVGTFHVNGYQPVGDHVYEDEITYNWVFTDTETVKNLQKAHDEALYGKEFKAEPQYRNVAFFAETPDRLDEIIDEVKHLDDIDAKSYQISADDTMYKSTVDSLNSIRNLVIGFVAVIVIGCAVVLLIVFTMWVKSRKKEIAIYLSLGLSKASILGQLVLEAVLIAVIASILSFGASQKVPDFIGNQLLAVTVAEAEPQVKEYTREELHEAAMSGTMGELIRYESSDYAGPNHIEFTFRFIDFAILLFLELLIIIGAICKGGSFIFQLEPRQIMSELQ